MNKVLLNKAIAKLNLQIAQAQSDLANCIASNTPPPPPPPPPPPAECLFIQHDIDNMNADLAEYQRELRSDPTMNKVLLQNAIGKLTLQIDAAQNALADCIANPPVSAPPATQPIISTDTTMTPVQKVISWDLVQRKVDEFFNKRTDQPLINIHLDHRDHVTSNGDLDNDPPESLVTISIIEADVVGGKTTTVYSPLAPPLKLGQLDYGFYFNDISSNSITISVDPTSPLPFTLKIAFECDGGTDIPSTTLLIPSIDLKEFYVTLKLSFDHIGLALEFLSWVDKIAPLKDDAFDNALTQYVVVHMVSTSAIDPGGAFQKTMRKKIFDQLNNISNRIALNGIIKRWLLGGKGNYDVTAFTNDGKNITMTYNVPADKLDPFPDSMFRPAGWPYAGNPKPDKSIKFATPAVMADIDHIVVLMMENRSFDQMLGYLSLPVSAGGMGRTDVDGLRGGESNPFQGSTTPSKSFAFAAGDTAFAPDPSHSYEPVFRQIDAQIDGNKLAIPGTGKMDGFVNSLIIDKYAGGSASRAMGYHTQVNVPVYDALVRDFAFSHRWFASHPGPTFCNRFYATTGRLNLASGLNPSLPENTWEFSNSSPLTPVFTKTIFDHLGDNNVSWKYYEHGYCFLRFFSKHTTNDTNIVSIDDPNRGFFTDAKNGTLPSVSYIDPHFIEYPPGANCDGPVADIAAGQDLVKRVVEAVVTSPKFDNTLLVVIYDEHGGFFDHVPPPAAVPFSDESPIKSYGVRVPAFFVSPKVIPGTVIGHDADAKGNTLYFDHTSMLKTIAKRFLSNNPPYMGPRYAAANDISSVLHKTVPKYKFLPFIRYNFMYNASKTVMDVAWANPAADTIIWAWVPNGTPAQDFSFEYFHGYYYIRTHLSNMYLTLDITEDAVANPPAQGIGVKQDVKHDLGATPIDNTKFEVKTQLWKLTAVGTNSYIITNPLFPALALHPPSLTQTGVQLVLGTRSTLASANAWTVTSPLLGG